MKQIVYKFGIVAFAIIGFSACKKDYTCTCTTTVAGISTTKTHDLQNQTVADATEACDRFEDDANSGGLGTTNCHL